MPNEKDKDAVETTEKETPKEPATDTPADKTDEGKDAPVANEGNPAPAEAPAEESQPAQVDNTEDEGNGIPLSEVVTKEYLSEIMAAFDAKYNAIVKENEDLKGKLAEAKQEGDGLRKKYEDGDFGNLAPKGVQEENKHANETFDEYSKNFM